MSNISAQTPAPSLIEVIKSLARDRAECAEVHNRAYEVWRQMPFDERKEPERQQLEASEAKYWGHPITRLFVLIEENGGPIRGKCEEAARRINTTIGLREYKRPPEAPGDGQHDWPDLLWVAREMNRLDADGTTARVLAAFERQHPEMVHLYRVVTAAQPTEAGAPSEAGVSKKTKGRDINGQMFKAMAEFPECLDWSSTEWAARLSCGEGTVRGTHTWKVILPNARAMRAAASSERMDSTRTHPRGRRRLKPA